MKKIEDVIIFDRVKKSYKIPGFLKNKEKTAIDNISFSVHRGEFVGLIGLNGAGKTTIMKIICGLIKPDSGSVSIFGKDLKTSDVLYKSLIGYLPELPYFYPHMTAYDTLRFYYMISTKKFDLKKIKETLNIVGLGGKEQEKVKNFSKGMMQKLGIACAIIHEPEIIVMDEPASGLDPLSIKEIRSLLLRLNSEGKTIFISSHSISEVEKMCQRVMLIHKGKILETFLINDLNGKNLEEIFIERVLNEDKNH
ncbi:MAG: ABC transporter ATP-binding protein [Elusimicrobiota bacterium]